MIKAVFLDLDDTLLWLDTDAFVKRYLTELTQLMLRRYPALESAEVPLSKVIQRAMGKTIQNLDPTSTNAAIFNAAVVDSYDLPDGLLQQIFDEFHQGDYLLMGAATSRIDAATSLVDRLAEMGLKAVIATNPLFPLQAVRQRLIWAGLDAPRNPFAFITNIEEMHFTKPAPHFYAELLARVGVEADETIMIGDNFTQDMIPAAQAGLNTFWLHWGNPLPNDVPADFMPDGSGSLAEFEQRVAGGWLTTLQPRPRTVAQIVPHLLGNVGALFGLVETIQPDYWNMRPDPNEWSPLEIICHLRDSERDVQRPRLQRIAHEDNPFISQPQPPPGPYQRNLTAEDGNRVLHEFWEERCQTLDFLNGLSTADWQRPARHSIFGPTTLMEMAHFTARHDRLHINQLCETLGRCRQEAHS
ncbi:MAG: DinB family protein [Chloroflexota bacterium]